MFGLYRYGLAFCVAISHLWAGMVGGPAAYAVWGFYCLSGYLMTLILNEKYGFSPRGVATFAVNRVLRIYPAYYVVCAAMFLLFLTIPETSARFLPHLKMPSDGNGWLFSATLMTPLGGGELVHGSSALRVELWFYLMMALGLGRGRHIAIAWFAASVAYTGWLLLDRVPFPERYTWISACSLAFSSGAMIYHYRDRLPAIRRPGPALAAAALWWAHVWASQKFPGGPWIIGLYSSLIASAVAMVTLMRLEPRRMPGRLARLDRLAGDLSYPIYLCHWAVGIAVVWLVPSLSRRSAWVFVIGFPIVNLVAYAIYRTAEAPLQSWKLPSRNKSSGPVARPDRPGGSWRLDAATSATPPPVAVPRLAPADRSTV